MKRQEADYKTSVITCPYCKYEFDPEEIVLKDFKDDELIAYCPSCESVLKRYRKNK